jgi:hypothetical protein
MIFKAIRTITGYCAPKDIRLLRIQYPGRGGALCAPHELEAGTIIGMGACGYDGYSIYKDFKSCGRTRRLWSLKGSRAQASHPV